MLKPTRIYVKTILELKDKFSLKGISHITGGGFIENIPRMVPEGCRVKINLGSWPVPPIFGLLQKLGGLSDASIYNTFNMGIGMVIAVRADEAADMLKHLEQSGEKAYRIGEIIKGEAGVELC